MTIAKEHATDRLWPEGNVLVDDRRWGERGLQGWTQLHDATNGWSSPIGIEPLGHGGGEYLTLTTKNGNSVRERDCTAIKRVAHVASVYDLEVWWAWRSINGQNGVRAIDFGLDNARPDGTRYYMKYRWGHYTTANRDGSGAVTRTNQLSVVDADSLYTQLPGSPTFAAATNENKSDMNYFRGRYDIANAKYLGCIFNSDGYGCFAGTGGKPDPTGNGDTTAFKAFASGPPSTLPSFAYGLNPSIDLLGRIDTTQNEATVNIDGVRLRVIA